MKLRSKTTYNPSEYALRKCADKLLRKTQANTAIKCLQPWLQKYRVKLMKRGGGGLSTNPHQMAAEWLRACPRAIAWDDVACSDSTRMLYKLLRRCPHKIATVSWELSRNPHWLVVQYLLRNPAHIHWTSFSRNPHPDAVALLLQNPNKIDWYLFHANTNPIAVTALRDIYADKINWCALSGNACPIAVEMLRANPQQINWYALCLNPSVEAMQLLRENPECIHHRPLCRNTHAAAAALLREYPQYIDWWSMASGSNLFDVLAAPVPQTDEPFDYETYSRALTCNPDPRVIPILQSFPDIEAQLDHKCYGWWCLTQNPGIFAAVADPIADHARTHFRDHVVQELMAHVWHPRNAARFAMLDGEADDAQHCM